MLFNYTATKDGKTFQGSAEAVDRQTLISMLIKQGARPVLVKASSKQVLKKGGKKVKLRELVIFTRQLSTMVSAGVPLTRSMFTLQTQSESKAFKEVISAVTKDIESGIPLADAFAKHPQVFSDIYINMVRAGEAGGILDEILKRLATQVEQDASMRKKIKGASAYPIALLGITVIAFFGIMLFVLPKIGAILKDIGGENAKLPIYTEILLKISNFLIGHTIIDVIPILSAIPIIKLIPNALFAALVFAVIIFFIKRYIKTPAGKYKFHALLLRIPLIKTVIIKIAIARFARTFASLMTAGVSVLDALEVTGGAIGNKVIEKELQAAAEAIKSGKQLSEPLAASPHFPPIVSQMLAIGEETGQMDTVLIKVADFYEEEVTVTIDSLSSLIEPIMIVVLGGMVGVIAASVMGPIASLSQNVGSE